MSASHSRPGLGDAAIRVQPQTRTLEQDLLRAILAFEATIAVTVEARGPRTQALERAVALLSANAARVIEVGSPDGEPLTLRRVLEQVISGRPREEDADPVEQFFSELTRPRGDERHLVLIINDAQLLGTDTLTYLALVGPSAEEGALPLQIVFAGQQSMWDRLPRNGSRSVAGITTRLVLADETMAAPAPLPATGGTVTPFTRRPHSGSAAVRAEAPVRFEPRPREATETSQPPASEQIPSSDGTAPRTDGQQDEPANAAPAPVAAESNDDAMIAAAQAGSAPDVPLAEAPSVAPTDEQPVTRERRRQPWAVLGLGLVAASGAIALWQERDLASITHPAVLSTVQHPAGADAPIQSAAATVADDKGADDRPAAQADAAPPPSTSAPARPPVALAAADTDRAEIRSEPPLPVAAPAPIVAAPVIIPPVADAAAPNQAPSLLGAPVLPTSGPLAELHLAVPLAAMVPLPGEPTATTPDWEDPAQLVALPPSDPSTEEAPSAVAETKVPVASDQPAIPASPAAATPPARPTEAAKPGDQQAIGDQKPALSQTTANPPPVANAAPARGPSQAIAAPAPAEPPSVVAKPAEATPAQKTAGALPTPSADPNGRAATAAGPIETAAVAASPAIDAMPSETKMARLDTPPAIPSSQAAPSPLTEALVKRGDAMLAMGDIAAARLLYARAVDAGSASAATALGMSHDPRFLAQIGAQGVTPDVKLAADWYRRATALGDPEAATLLPGLLAASGE